MKSQRWAPRGRWEGNLSVALILALKVKAFLQVTQMPAQFTREDLKEKWSKSLASDEFTFPGAFIGPLPIRSLAGGQNPGTSILCYKT